MGIKNVIAVHTFLPVSLPPCFIAHARAQSSFMRHTSVCARFVDGVELSVVRAPQKPARYHDQSFRKTRVECRGREGECGSPSGRSEALLCAHRRQPPLQVCPCSGPRGEGSHCVRHEGRFPLGVFGPVRQGLGRAGSFVARRQTGRTKTKKKQQCPCPLCLCFLRLVECGSLSFSMSLHLLERGVGGGVWGRFALYLNATS